MTTANDPTVPTFGEPDEASSEPQRPPIPFALSGRYRNPERYDEETWTESFTAFGEPPLGTIFSLAAMERPDGSMNLAAVIEFFRGMLPDEEARRFARLVNDKDRLIHAKALAGAAQYIVERSFDRPTRPPASSPGGSSIDASTFEGGFV